MHYCKAVLLSYGLPFLPIMFMCSHLGFRAALSETADTTMVGYVRDALSGCPLELQTGLPRSLALLQAAQAQL